MHMRSCGSRPEALDLYCGAVYTHRYWLNPISWVLLGFVTSQLGNVTSTFETVSADTLLA